MTGNEKPPIQDYYVEPDAYRYKPVVYGNPDELAAREVAEDVRFYTVDTETSFDPAQQPAESASNDGATESVEADRPDPADEKGFEHHMGPDQYRKLHDQVLDMSAELRQQALADKAKAEEAAEEAKDRAKRAEEARAAAEAARAADGEQHQESEADRILEGDQLKAALLSQQLEAAQEKAELEKKLAAEKAEVEADALAEKLRLEKIAKDAEDARQALEDAENRRKAAEKAEEARKERQRLADEQAERDRLAAMPRNRSEQEAAEFVGASAEAILNERAVTVDRIRYIMGIPPMTEEVSTRLNEGLRNWSFSPTEEASARERLQIDEQQKRLAHAMALELLDRGMLEVAPGPEMGRLTREEDAAERDEVRELILRTGISLYDLPADNPDRIRVERALAGGRLQAAEHNENWSAEQRRALGELRPSDYMMSLYRRGRRGGDEAYIAPPGAARFHEGLKDGDRWKVPERLQIEVSTEDAARKRTLVVGSVDTYAGRQTSRIMRGGSRRNYPTLRRMRDATLSAIPGVTVGEYRRSRKAIGELTAAYYDPDMSGSPAEQAALALRAERAAAADREDLAGATPNEKLVSAWIDEGNLSHLGHSGKDREDAKKRTSVGVPKSVPGIPEDTERNRQLNAAILAANPNGDRRAMVSRVLVRALDRIERKQQSREAARTRPPAGRPSGRRRVR